MNTESREALEDCPVIAAIKDFEGLECCLKSDVKIIFILFGDICNIASIVKKLKDNGKITLIHVDLITGLSTKAVAIDFIQQNTNTDGIISTKPTLVKYAKTIGLLTVLRIFVIDSLALENVKKQVMNAKPDLIEILPGLMPKVIKKLCTTIQTPIIAGGLISDKEDIMSALSAGAISISTTNPSLWFV